MNISIAHLLAVINFLTTEADSPLYTGVKRAGEHVRPLTAAQARTLVERGCAEEICVKVKMGALSTWLDLTKVAAVTTPTIEHEFEYEKHKLDDILRRVDYTL